MTLTNRNKRIESAMRMAVRQRNYRRVRDRALTRLAQAYPETYKELLELEKVTDETNGAKWVDIDGSSSFIVGVSAGASGREPVGDPADIAEGEGERE